MIQADIYFNVVSLFMKEVTATKLKNRLEKSLLVSKNKNIKKFKV